MNWEIWGPPFAVLGASVVAGVLFLWGTPKRPKPNEKHKHSSLAELQALKAQLMEALRELEADRQKMTEVQWLSRREVLLQETEQVLKALDAEATGLEGVVGDEEIQSNNEKPQKIIWGYLVVSVVFFAILGVLLGQYARPRADGEIMTGAKEQTTMEAESNDEWHDSRLLRYVPSTALQHPYQKVQPCPRIRGRARGDG